MAGQQKVLFLGNSITRHAPAAELGWFGDWGMAASSEDNDYVHILMRQFQRLHTDALFMVKNIADFERSFWNYDLDQLAEACCFAANIVIMKIGENVDEKEPISRDFGLFYSRLIQYINPQNSTVLCVGSFWDKPFTNGRIRKVAEEFGYPYVNISLLSKDEYNTACKLFSHAGVGAHPSDTGMIRIADLIWDTLN